MAWSCVCFHRERRNLKEVQTVLIIDLRLQREREISSTYWASSELAHTLGQSEILTATILRRRKLEEHRRWPGKQPWLRRQLWERGCKLLSEPECGHGLMGSSSLGCPTIACKMRGDWNLRQTKRLQRRAIYHRPIWPRACWWLRSWRQQPCQGSLDRHLLRKWQAWFLLSYGRREFPSTRTSRTWLQGSVGRDRLGNKCSSR